MRIRILVVDDDYQELHQICEHLNSRYEGLEIVDRASAVSFASRIRWLELEPPDLAIIDIMLNDDLRGGVECLRLMQHSSELKKVPVILYTALSWNEIAAQLNDKPEHVVHLEKRANLHGFDSLFRSLLRAAGKQPRERSAALTDIVGDAIEVKIPVFGGGVKVDVKKIKKGLDSKKRKQS